MTKYVIHIIFLLKFLKILLCLSFCICRYCFCTYFVLIVLISFLSLSIKACVFFYFFCCHFFLFKYYFFFIFFFYYNHNIYFLLFDFFVFLNQLKCKIVHC